MEGSNFMTVGKIFKNLLIDTSVFFSVITPIYAALHMIVNTVEEEALIPVSFLLYIFLFSLLGAISMLIYRINTLNKALRIAIQYAIILFASYACFFAPLGMTGANVMVGLALASVIYALILGVCLFFSHAFKKNKVKEEVYESKFKKTK
jgi:uncharacterized membrane protein